MNCVYLRTLFCVIILLTCISVSFAQSSIEKDMRNEIFSDVYKYLTKTYCNDSAHSVVKIYMDNFTCSNCSHEKTFALNRFLKDYLSNRFHYATKCIEVVSKNISESDITISGGVYDRSYINKDYPITVSISMKESSKVNFNYGEIIFGERYNFHAENFNQKEFDKYKHKNSKVMANRTDKSMIVIKAVNLGENYKEEDKFFLKTIYGTGWIDQQLFKEDTGFSGYYPADQKIEIDGNIFDMNSKNEFFYGSIHPGVYEINAKFKEAYWDAYNQQQNIRKEKNKKFKIAVNTNDNLEVKIYFIYDGEKSDIQVQAFRKKQKEVGRTIKEIREVIEVYY